MRKFLFLILGLFYLVSFSQECGWDTVFIEADPLLEIDSTIFYVYTEPNVGQLSFYKIKDNNHFSLTTFNGIFNSNSYDYSWILVGYYDEHNCLIKKDKLALKVSENSETIYTRRLMRPRGENKLVLQILKYIQEGVGYVRFYADIYNSSDDFNLIIPCLNTLKHD